MANDRFVGPLNLVIEILSPGSENRRRDLVAKRRLYGKFQVEEYWIVDPESRGVMIFRLEESDLKEAGILKDDDVISSPLLPDLKLSVSAIFNLE